MKKIVLGTVACLLFINSFGQVGSDSAAYQLQRARINAMLDQRRQKFGQYEQSLSQHTGIFGLQTKKDVRRSNAILTDIVNTDDELYKQIKILLDYRVFQQTQVQDKSKETENYNVGLMNVVNRMRAENEKLKKESNNAAIGYENTKRNLIILIVLMVASILWLLWRKYAGKG